MEMAPLKSMKDLELRHAELEILRDSDKSTSDQTVQVILYNSRQPGSVVRFPCGLSSEKSPAAECPSEVKKEEVMASDTTPMLSEQALDENSGLCITLNIGNATIADLYAESLSSSSPSSNDENGDSSSDMDSDSDGDRPGVNDTMAQLLSRPPPGIELLESEELGRHKRMRKVPAWFDELPSSDPYNRVSEVVVNADAAARVAAAARRRRKKASASRPKPLRPVTVMPPLVVQVPVEPKPVVPVQQYVPHVQVQPVIEPVIEPVLIPETKQSRSERHKSRFAQDIKHILNDDISDDEMRPDSRHGQPRNRRRSDELVEPSDGDDERRRNRGKRRPRNADDSETDMEDDIVMSSRHHKKQPVIRRPELTESDILWNKTRASVAWRWKYLQHKMVELENKLDVADKEQPTRRVMTYEGSNVKHPLYSIKAPYNGMCDINDHYDDVEWLQESLPRGHKSTPVIDIPKMDTTFMTPIRLRSGGVLDTRDGIPLLEAVTPNIATPRWKRVESTADLLMMRSPCDPALSFFNNDAKVAAPQPANTGNSENTPCSDTVPNEMHVEVKAVVKSMDDEDGEIVDILNVDTDKDKNDMTMTSVKQLTSSSTAMDLGGADGPIAPFSDVWFSKIHFQLELEERRKFLEGWTPDTRRPSKARAGDPAPVVVSGSPGRDRSQFMKLPAYTDPIYVQPRRFDVMRSVLGLDAPQRILEIKEDPVKVAITRARRKLFSHLNTQRSKMLAEKQQRDMAIAELTYQRGGKKKKRVTFGDDVTVEHVVVDT